MASPSMTQHRRPAPPEGGGEPEPKRLKPSYHSHPRTSVHLNPADCSLDFNVGADGLDGYALHENGFAYCWSGARATVGIMGGKYCFGCKIISEQEVQMEDTPPDQQHVCRVGISRGDDPVGNLGESAHSFGYGGTGKFSHAGRFSDYGAKFGVGDVIVCCVDLEAKPLATIGFSNNGNWLGHALKFNSSPNGLAVVDSSLQKREWQSAVFPHVLLKNVVIQMQFSREDGLIPEEGYKPWGSALEDGNAVSGPSFASMQDCEVMMMVGLPASGKTTWAEKWIMKHPEKRYVLIGTNVALDRMKVPGLLRQKNYGERFERLMDQATEIFNTLLSRAAKTPCNYILDQTNVYKNARKRKLKDFENFKKIAVVVFPSQDELKARAHKRYMEMGKEVPADAVNQMLANYVLPSSKDISRAGEPFDQVIFPELSRPEAQKCLDEMKNALIIDSSLNKNYSSPHGPHPHDSPLPSPVPAGHGPFQAGVSQSPLQANYDYCSDDRPACYTDPGLGMTTTTPPATCPDQGRNSYTRSNSVWYNSNTEANSSHVGSSSVCNFLPTRGPSPYEKYGSEGVYNQVNPELSSGGRSVCQDQTLKPQYASPGAPFAYRGLPLADQHGFRSPMDQYGSSRGSFRQIGMNMPREDPWVCQANRPLATDHQYGSYNSSPNTYGSHSGRSPSNPSYRGLPPPQGYPTWHH